MNRRAVLALCALLLAACGRSSGAAPSFSSGATALPSAVAIPSPSASAAITVGASRYGMFEINTRPLEKCELSIRVNAGIFGDGPPQTLVGRADATGSLAWTYPAPLIPAGNGRHVVTCSDDRGQSDVWSEFSVSLKALDAKGFTARVQAVDPATGLDGVSTRLEPSLVAARDATVTKLNDTLAKEWLTATRGLGGLTLVTSSADIVIYVVPGRSSSLHSLANDGTQRILLFMVDDLGPISAENAVATALHELGHIWCCHGTDAGTDGHWLEKIPDPLLQGVDRFGLMTHPVTCLVGPGFQSCPNRFSERELRAMGFTQIPAPPPDPCLAQANALRSQIATLDGRLASERRTIDATKAEMAGVAARIADIERRYPGNTLPPDVYATYVGLIDQYNRLASENQVRIDAYNNDVDTRNTLVQRLNALPC
ncbi:MAG TPA: hypothetical protein VGR87_12345 [Candidatus Limnocylindria bacterium]|jgi:hypothetical protein|nr:hypothetical protein [Candidatus Limnocylindria bacterium]